MLASDVETFGPTVGCAACESVVTHGRVIGSSHTEECRLRMGNLLARDDAGLERLRRYNLRSEEAEAPPPEAGATAVCGSRPGEGPAEAKPTNGSNTEAQDKTKMQEDTSGAQVKRGRVDDQEEAIPLPQKLRADDPRKRQIDFELDEAKRRATSSADGPASPEENFTPAAVDTEIGFSMAQASTDNVDGDVVLQSLELLEGQRANTFCCPYFKKPGPRDAAKQELTQQRRS